MKVSASHSIDDAALWMEVHSIPLRMQRCEWEFIPPWIQRYEGKFIPSCCGFSAVDGCSFHSKEHNLEGGKEWSEMLSLGHDMAASLTTLQQLWLPAQALVGEIAPRLAPSWGASGDGQAQEGQSFLTEHVAT